ncbi:MAG: ATPase, T2SS/T4P/T4SS family [Hallerella porci]|uniref:Tfp pilus assembly pilus retraction ATPase PilT n=1 Tax=Hallerella porci TaxID=1945871 RepID=A0ABX5LTE8_9BACT|nr:MULTISPECIES: ATPase, T2SS/T4P/T4SS family [Hallerella]MCI5600742.1 Flp pilus assembly complex ATPase component TadA [Hallerella sp.]MDY3922376.1 ATPase, T2SS/T4P/T4SS family [Hallerella porci]PWL03720.1 Tfp pilus assembly pilus retraction ATPase PilT [Hallerella porci]
MLNLNVCLNYALQSGATDVILAEGFVPNVRIAGSLHAIPETEKLSFGDLESALGSLEGECGAFIGGPWQNANWRVRYSREAFGKMATLRAVGADSPNLAALEAPESVSNLIGASSGLILFTGPIASGKTTTASAYVSEVCNSRILRAAFLDPLPEYKIYSGESLVRKRRSNVPLTKDIVQNLRAGTDLFWLGDVSLSESVLPMLCAAEMGSLVVATLNADSAKSAITNLLSLEESSNRELARNLLAANLKAVVSEHLILSADKTSLVPAWEVLYNDTSVAPLIHAGEYFRIPQVMRAATSEGSLPLDDSLLQLVRGNRISKADARVYAMDETLFLD